MMQEEHNLSILRQMLLSRPGLKTIRRQSCEKLGSLFTSSKNEDYQKILLSLFSLLLFTSSKNEDYQKIHIPLFSLLLFNPARTTEDFQKMLLPLFSLLLFTSSKNDRGFSENALPPPPFSSSLIHIKQERGLPEIPHPVSLLLFTSMNEEDYQKKTPHSCRQTMKIIREAPPPLPTPSYSLPVFTPRSSVSWVTG